MTKTRKAQDCCKVSIIMRAKEARTGKFLKYETCGICNVRVTNLSSFNRGSTAQENLALSQVSKVCRECDGYDIKE
ncbi:hypothetical protein J6590_028353 [Homalodisca vitripennis]|nr:hypothetical protein J6590_028353 [Homalodisca vitripennis]